jgi:hypothetical protein
MHSDEMEDGSGCLFFLQVIPPLSMPFYFALFKWNFQVRITSGALIIAGELTLNTNLLLAAYILEYAGLAFLLLSSLGFIGMA